MNLYRLLVLVIGVGATAAIIIVTTTSVATVEERHQLTCCVVEQDYHNNPALAISKYKFNSYDEWLEKSPATSITSDCKDMNLDICPSMLSGAGLYLQQQ